MKRNEIIIVLNRLRQILLGFNGLQKLEGFVPFPRGLRAFILSRPSPAPKIRHVRRGCLSHAGIEGQTTWQDHRDRMIEETAVSKVTCFAVIGFHYPAPIIVPAIVLH